MLTITRLFFSQCYIPTAINVFNGMENAVDLAVNRAEWDERNPDESKRANPLWFDGRFGEVRRRWVEEGAVFGRKFKALTAEEWRRVVGQD